ncbi:transmembrane emp24 domain-containing protein 6 [Caerostris extrusa]|uniref:Transmembrane emp24 domain-containing protein 6 n=1 Tax=Caerostris extrusa TaxID=172846 RepID=A0AAV4UQ86_CAEEX|nr:transmembrane emp24 domain-containing protein 6 [Caerostris extrusa]
MATVDQLLIGILWFCFVTCCFSETYTFDQNIGVAYEFKIHVDAGKEECFSQYVHPGSTFYVAFQVMRGGDGMAGFAVRHPSGQLVLPYYWKPSAEYEEQTADPGGYYHLCIDNSLSRFASKLVSMYVNSFKRDKWEDYIKELEETDVTVANFTETLQTVDGRIGEMLKYQDQSRRQMSRDWYVVDGNHSYIQTWSIAQCIVIFLTSTLQVYFVRKLFEVKNVTPTAKPRA